MFEDFVASFEDTDKGGKTFVRGSTITPGSTGIKLNDTEYLTSAVMLYQRVSAML